MPVPPAPSALLVPAVELSGVLKFSVDGETYAAELARRFYTPRALVLALLRAMRDALPDPASPSGYGFRLHYRLVPVDTGPAVDLEGGALYWSAAPDSLALTVLHSDPETYIATPDGLPLVRGGALFPDLGAEPGTRVRWTAAGAPAANPAQAAQFVWPLLRHPVRLQDRKTVLDLGSRAQVETEDGSLWSVGRGGSGKFSGQFAFVPGSRWTAQGWDRALAPDGALAAGAPADLHRSSLLETHTPVRATNRTIDTEEPVTGFRTVKLQLAVQPEPEDETDRSNPGGEPFTFGRKLPAAGFTAPLTGSFGGDTSYYSDYSGLLLQTGSTPAGKFARLRPLDAVQKTADARIRVKLWRPYPFSVAGGSLWEAGILLAHNSGGAGTAVVAHDTGSTRELRAYPVLTDGSKGTPVTLGTLTQPVPRDALLQENPAHWLTAEFQLFTASGGTGVVRVRASYNGEGPFEGCVIPYPSVDSAGHEWMLAVSNNSVPPSNTVFGAPEIWEDKSE